MSPLSRERLLIELSPSCVTLVRRRGLPGTRIVARSEHACSPPDGEPAWRTSIATLQAALADLRNRASEAVVVLSNHYIRYALLPWNDAIRGADEELAYARHHFTRIFGERAKGWTLRASIAPSGAPRIASGVDSGLLEALAGSFAQRDRPRLVSIQPSLMAVYNRWRGAFPAAGAWLILLEPGRACLALQSAGRWRVLRSTRAPIASSEELTLMLERERDLVDGEVPDLVLVHAARTAAAGLQAPGWRLQPLPCGDENHGHALAAT